MEQSQLISFEQCPVCRRSDLRPSLALTDHYISKEQFQLMDCRTCGFRMTNPHPSATTIGPYYEAEQYISHSNNSASIQDKLYQFARNRALHGKLKLLRKYRTNGKVLDNGSGTGEFMGYIQSRGYQVRGVEPALKPREASIRVHSLDVVPALSKVQALEQFDIATMWHVMEHLHDLHPTLKGLFARLKSAGYLILAVPDRDSWDAEHYGEFWSAYDVPRHLYHFRRQDVDSLLDQHGFEVLEHKRMPYDAPYISMYSEKFKGHGNLVALIKGVLIGAWSNLHSLLGKRPTSSTLYVAQKRRI